MPNWVNNTLFVHKSFSDKIIKDGKVDFNIVAPVDDLFQYTSSPIPDDYIALYKYSIGEKEPLEKMAEEKRMPVSALIVKIITRYEEEKKSPWNQNRSELFPTPESYGKLHCDLLKKYGYSDWYNCHVSRWGTKWPASETEIEDYDKNFLKIYFNTPWSPPDEYLKTLAKAGVPFLHIWEEEQGYQGIIQSIGNTIIEIGLPTLHYRELDDGYYRFYECEEVPNMINGIQKYSDDEDGIACEDENGTLILEDAIDVVRFEMKFQILQKETETALSNIELSN